jgi:hypothetical protein
MTELAYTWLTTTQLACRSGCSSGFAFGSGPGPRPMSRAERAFPLASVSANELPRPR